MRTYGEVWEDAKDERPFSNGTEGYAWTDNWCGTCVHEAGDNECPLLGVALMGRTPIEWIEQPWGQVRGQPEGVLAPSLGDTYHCIMHREEGDDGGEPEPIPDPPDQGLLLPREPYEGVRMYVDVVSEVDLVSS